MRNAAEVATIIERECSKPPTRVVCLTVVAAARSECAVADAAAVTERFRLKKVGGGGGAPVALCSSRVGDGYDRPDLPSATFD